MDKEETFVEGVGAQHERHRQLPMTVIVELRPEIEAGLAVLAAEQGVTLTHYIRRLLEQQIQVDQAERSPAERAAAWRKSATGLPHTPPLPDDASSREILYSARG